MTLQGVEVIGPVAAIPVDPLVDLDEPVRSQGVYPTLRVGYWIADQGRYPAFNILSSVSRIAHQIWTPEQRELIGKLKAMVARFEDTRDLRLMGGYHPGRDAELDQSVKFVPRLYDALRQTPQQAFGDDPFRELSELLKSG